MAPLELTNTHPALRYCWHPVARSADVGDRPVRVVLLGEPWVLARLAEDGGLAAFPDRCPHRMAPLSLGSVDVAEGGAADVESGAAAVAGGGPRRVLRCAYHGWCFAAEGRCVEIPALGPGSAHIPPKAHLRAAAGVAERHGMVFLRPLAPEPGHPGTEELAALAALPDVEEAHDPAFMAGDLPVLRARASAGLLADNFLDMAHFPFVHAATFGAEDPVVAPMTVERAASGAFGRWSFTSVSEHPFLHREDPGVADGVRPLVQRRRVTYRVHAPFHLVLRLDFLDAGGTNVIGFFLQPETEDRTRIYSTLWRDDVGHDPERMRSAVDFELKVVEEDLAVQEAYDVLSLPLDPAAEVHTRADRTTLELRRMLAELVDAAAVAGGPARRPTASVR